MTYAFEKDISLNRMAELLVKSLEFDAALSLAKQEFFKRFEAEEVSNLTGDALTVAIDRIRSEAYSSPVFEHLRSQMTEKSKRLKDDCGTIRH
jgi:hypothetical protein